MRRLLLLLPIVATGAMATFFGACGDSGDDAPPLTASTYLNAYDDAVCEYVVHCGQAPDVATCHKIYGQDAEVAQAISSVLFGTLQFDAAAAQGCIDALKAAVCEIPYPYGVAPDVKTKCDAVFTSGAKDGDACYVGLECQSGFCKAGKCNDACCVGQCTSVSTAVPDGGDCSMSACVSGDYCDESMGMHVCKPRVGANDVCTQPDACELGYRCDTGSSKCFKLAASGAQCNPDLSVSPCLSVAEYCDKAQQKCVPLPKAGSPCTSDPTPNLCAADALCLNGTCVAMGLPGEDCVDMRCMGSVSCDMDSLKCPQVTPVFTCLPTSAPPMVGSSSASTGTGS
jgi:hypothetical protein